MQPKLNKLYALPMLGRDSDSYETSHFITEINAQKDMHMIIIKMHTDLQNKELEQLVDDGSVCYACHVECSQTSFRQVYLTSQSDDIFHIDASLINGKLEISTFLVVNKVVPNFTSTDFTKEYAGLSFTLQRGLVIGIGSFTSFEVEKHQGEFSDSPSIFSIVLDANKRNNEAHIELTDHKIQICLPEKAFRNYRMVSRAPQYMETIHSMLLVPALMKALIEIQSTDGVMTHQDSRWFKSLDAACQRGGHSLTDFIKSTDPFIAAQKLLNGPLVKGLEKLATGDDSDEG